jgi:hypothetical protein
MPPLGRFFRVMWVQPWAALVISLKRKFEDMRAMQPCWEIAQVPALVGVQWGGPGASVLDTTAQELPSAVSLTRASAAWSTSSAGSLVASAAHVARFDTDPVSLVFEGLLLEGSRTNSLRNNTMQGAATGNPGTPPNFTSTGSLQGLTRSIDALGTENGLDYIDYRFFGTPTTTGQPFVSFESNSVVAAVQNEAWTLSAWVKLQAGSLTNVSNVQLAMNEFNSSITYLTGGGSAFTPTATRARFSFTRTMANAAAAFVQPLLAFNVTSGLAVDFTLRVYNAQLEKGGFASSVIKTTGVAATRLADVAVLPSLQGLATRTVAGTVLCEGYAAPGSGTQTFWQLDDGTDANRVRLYRNSSNQLRANVQAAGVDQCDLLLGTVANNANFKAAFAFQAGNFAGVMAGGSVQSVSTGTLPACTQGRLGRDNAGNEAFGQVRRLMLTPVREENAQLLNLVS